MSSNIKKRIDELVMKFQSFDSWQERYKLLMDMGKEDLGLNKEDQLDKFKVKGCQSQVWLVPSFEKGVVYFRSDSDSMLVKGIASLLTRVYSGATPDAILAEPPKFLEEIGITEHLSLNRTNGLRSMVKQIQMYAMVYKSTQG
jgi:cysteine desulfuration protein SufE